MLRLLHTADVHLGARHADLGDAAAAQRERQFAAFSASVDLALAEKVDLFLVAGDLFDSNTQPRRSVERVAAELARLVKGPHPDRDHPRHARRLRPLVGLPRLRPGRPRRRPAHRGARHRAHAGAPVDPLRGDRCRGPRPGVRDQARPAQPPPGPRCRRDAARDLEDRPAARGHRDRRPHGPGRGRHHHQGDRRQRPRLPRAGALALGPDGEGQAMSRTPTPAPRSPLPWTRIAPARCSW